MNPKIEDVYALSPLQQAMLYHTLAGAGAETDNEQICLSLEGALDVAAFRQAWERVIARHPILRSSFHWKKIDKPVQVVHRQAALPWAEEDWRELPAEEQEARLETVLGADRERDFNLVAAPVMRLGLFHLADRRYYLAWTFHHLLLDGSSASQVLEQVFALYHALHHGQEPSLPPPRPYRDYIVWLQNQDLSRARTFWQTELAGFGAPTALGPQRAAAPPGASTPGNGRRRTRLSEPATAALSSFAGRHRLAPETPVLGAWALLLSRYAGQQEVVFGITADGRPPDLAGSEAMVGLFVNVLPLRVRLFARARLGPWLQQLEARRRELRRWEYLPLTQIGQWSEVPSDQPLFESMVAWATAAAPEGSSDGLRIRSVTEPHAPFALNVFARLGSQLELEAVYDGRRFDATACQRLVGHLRTLLEHLATDPWQELWQAPLLSPAERRSLLAEWNDTAAPYPRGQLVHELFEDQVRRRPQAPAVVSADRRLSYRQLNERSNQLAHRLRALGVGPETPVAVGMDRAPEMVVCLLAVLKAGGFYVPLDPAHPRQRLARILDDVGPRVLLTEEPFLEIFPHRPAATLCPPAEWAAMAGETTDDPLPRAVADNLAYTIYTSGSTGRPKGVQISHRSLVNFLTALGRQPGLTAEDAVLAITTISFDIAGLELYLPLIAGGRVELTRREEAADGGALARRLKVSGATVVQATPASWQMLLRAGWEGSPGLVILCGGEALPRGLATELRARGAAVWNLYGPTETTIWSTAWPLNASPDEAGAHDVEPIGRPIANTRIYVLDRHLQPLPVAVAGELCVGGDGLARGYCGRPALSAEHFVPDGLSGESGARLYRTGDLARFRADGVIEFLGRKDHQVKVRGFRIELGEIEAALGRHPAVRQAAVTARETAPGAGDVRLVAYVVAAGEPPPAADQLRRFLQESLPDYMVPAVYVALPALPLTPSGKVDRRSLPDPDGGGLGLKTPYAAPRSEAEQTIAGIWQELLRVDQVGVRDNFFDLGGHSLLMGQLLARLRQEFDCELGIVDLFQNPTVSALAARLAPAAPAAAAPAPDAAPDAVPAAAPEAIAVVGMAGRFPGAAGIDELWSNLCAGVEGISFFSDPELLAAGLTPAQLANPQLVKARGVLADTFGFDAGFFGMNPGEATITDPQHRVFLETAWQALEDAGYDPETFPGAIGVYAGTSYSTYWAELMSSDLGNLGPMGEMQIPLANDKDYLPTRVSYKLNLKGPSVSVQTACSTSLVAIHQACQGLLHGECDMALAGGVSISTGQQRGYRHQEGGILSPDGHCRAFDAEAQGTVPGSGVGIVVLRRLADALAAGDAIRAVVRGSAVNNDGSLKVGFTAPSVEGQAKVVAAALARAGVDPETVTLIEAHGTGTRLGDPVEIAALSQAFGPTSRRGYCAVGSVKTNLGHLDAAAGVAGFIKATLALEHRTLPPTLHFHQPNPEINFERSPFYVNTRLKPWPDGDGPRRAGVSSFGLGGTNAHVVLEQAPAPPPDEGSRPWQLLVISARTASALEVAAANLGRHLEARPELELADVAYTLQVGRRAFPHRRCLVCRDREDAVAALRAGDPERVFNAVAAADPRPVAFMFPGQGAQHPGMGRELYRSEPAFGETVDVCAERLLAQLGLDLREALFPEAGTQAGLEQTALAQPALFVVEYALAQLWSSWGVAPQAMIGHSIGEYVAACLAGVFSLPQALELVAARGRLMQGLPGGAMVAVPLAAERVQPLLGGELCLAAVNEPGRSVVSGPVAAVEALERRLTADGVGCRRLHTSHAFHSAMMDPILEEFERQVRRAAPQAPGIPFISNLTGTWIEATEAADAGYWARHLRRTVQLSQGLGELLRDPALILLEVGPGHTLTTSVRSRPDLAREPAAIPSLGHPRDQGSDLASLLAALGRLWLLGVPVDWKGFHARARRRRVPLPTFPFEREQYRIEPDRPRMQEAPPREEEVRVAEPVPPPVIGVAAESRKQRLVSQLRELYGSVTGLREERIRPEASFLELGLDSLHLLQASHVMEKHFGVKVPFRRLMVEITTLEALAEHLDRTLPPEAPAPAPAAVSPPAPPAPAPAAGSLEAVMTQQLQVMAEQSQALTRMLADQSQVFAQISEQLSALRGRPQPAPAAPAPPAAEDHLPPAPYVPHRPARVGAGELSARQQAHLEALVARLDQRCRKSKQLAREQRPVLADGRASAGFQLALKELHYPIFFQHGSGSRVWDVDDNEYVDLTMGFGSLLFGHAPPFVVEAVEEQIQRGLGIGLESPLAGEAARLICEMTGCERAAFVNSGSEAVMTAVRLARTRTGRSKIAVFEGGYHGFQDEALVSGVPDGAGGLRSLVMVPGIPSRVADEVMVVEYCTAKSIEILRRCAHELAAVMVEPQQSRRAGGFEPGEFLRRLRELTAQAGTALILDEVITGFRIHPGGAQALYGVRADLVTYGKGIGAGVPAAAVAGRAEYLDGLDGGTWSYGDGSYPQAESTYVAGTFFKHPLTMAAVWAVLNHFKNAGPQLQQRMTARAERLAAAINDFCAQEQLPIRMLQWGSICNFLLGPELRNAPVFFAHMLENGVYVREKRPVFLSTAHTGEDLERVIAAFRRTVAAMREGGFLPAARRPPAADRRRAPATEAQKELFTLAQLGEDASRAYNEGVKLRWPGELRFAPLYRALRQVVARHEALRTTFNATGDEVWISSRVPVEVPVNDLSRLDDAHRRAEAARMLAEEANRTFDLLSGPLFRFRVVRLEPDDHLLTATFHHIVVDGLSIDVTFHEIAALYASACRGEGDRLPDPAPFREFAAWQRRWQEGAEMAAAEAFWLAEFADSVPVLELPTDRPRPPWRSFAGGWRATSVADREYEALQRTCSRSGSTLFVTLLAAFQLLLHRLTGQDDLVAGAAAAGQVAMGNQPLVGHCVNVLPMRSRIAGNPSFAEFQAGVRKKMLDAHEHQHYPFHRLVHQLNLALDPSRPPLVSAILNLDRAVGEDVIRIGEIALELEPNRCRGAKFELFFDLTAYDERLEINGNYNRDLFDGTTIGRWLGHFRTLLAAIADRPERSVWQLPLLSAGEREELITEWGGRKVPLPPPVLVHELFAAQAGERPAAVAIACGEIRLSYGELEARANQLAHFLRHLGVGPEDRVALCLERGPEVVLAMLGVLKADAAYVPLDPTYPRERREWMLEDSQARVLLTCTRWEKAWAGAGVQVLNVERDWEKIADHSPAKPDTAAVADNLAYVMYTSGSTGTPKGVAVVHRNVVRLVRETDFADFGPEEVFLLLAPISFDASTLEIWGPLLNGGRLAVVAAEKPSLQELGDLIARCGVSTLWLTAGLFHEMVEASPEALRPLGQLLAGGDVLSVPHVEKVLHQLPGLRLINGYGPTENTTFTCCHSMRGQQRFAFSVPIGRPIANTRIYLLDRRGELVPPGAPGELYVGGWGVGRGYLDRPALTAEKFVPDALGPEPGSRLYRTGDLARHRDDGTVLYLGRMDTQVKVRGFRVEPGEIETFLLHHERVREAAVVALPDPTGDKRLAAYLVAADGTGADELAQYLGERLPPYMVPSFFLFLDRLPLTPNGKLDRRALPAPDEAGQPRDVGEPPRTPTEARLAKIWCRVLGMDRVNVDDNFFRLGGHSLLATRLISQVRREFELDLPLRELFEAPTVAELARGIDAALPQAPPPPIRRAPRDGPLPLSFAQQRLWFLDRLTRGSPIYNIAAAWKITGPLDVGALRHSLDTIVGRHEALRTRFPSRLGRPSQVISPSAAAPLTVVDLSLPEPDRREAETRRLATAEAHRPFDLAHDRLLRVTLVRPEAGEAVLLVTMHHIISDGWSMGVFLEELTALYDALSQGRPSPLPEPAVQYADFAAWQRQWLKDEVLREQLTYWEDRLAAVEPLELATDRPRSALQVFRGEQLPFELPGEIADALHALSQRHGATLYMTLLAAFQTLLHRHTGQTTIVVGSPIANRNHPELEGLIGFFVNLLAMRADFSGDPPFADLLDQVGAAALEAYAHQDLPFEKLVEYLQPDRDLSRNPIFQVVIALQNAPLSASPMAELQVRALAAEVGTTRFDVELHLWESGGGIRGNFNYDGDLFEASTIALLAEHFRTLLAGIAADPGRAVSALPLSSRAERDRLVTAWAGREVALPEPAVVHELFRKAAAARPQAIATVCGEQWLSYGELNDRANQMARFLRRVGVGPEQRVALLIDRSPEQVVAMLAVLKAGGAYVPLDPSYPRERLKWMLEDTRARVLVTGERWEKAVAGAGVEVLNPERDRERIAQEGTTDPSVPVGAENLAYVMYTSGSTGTPKGVAVAHRSIVRLVRETDFADFSPQEVFLELAPITFDASTLEIWGPLLNGGRLAILPAEKPSLGELGEAIARYRVSTLWLTAGLFHQMVETSPEGLGPLRQLLAGGDVLSIPHVEKVLRELPGVRLINGYGPTENTTFTCCHPMRGEQCFAGSVPIGRPIANTRIYLLDRYGGPAPQGAWGELSIGGPGLARGYLDRPALTAERFVPSPVGPEPGARLYRTGDLARHRADGTVLFGGRIDTQVKVRGFRVEPGEIATWLRRYEGVREVAVLALPDPSGNKRLTAYLVAEPGLEPAAEELSRFLGERLPPYMVPAFFVFLDHLPLTPNGKLDRRALPPPEEAVAAAEDYQGPRNLIEGKVLRIWKEVLGSKRIGVLDDFFELGGHSLLATQIVSRIQETFGCELPLRAVFEEPTVAGLAGRIETDLPQAAPPPIVAVPRHPEMPLSFGQQRLWFLDRLVPNNSFYNIAAAWKLVGRVDLPTLERSLNEIARRHETLRTRFPEQGGRPVQLIAPPAPLPVPVIDLSALSEEIREAETVRLTTGEALRPFELASGPLMRATILWLRDQEVGLLVTMHHVVSDGWSMGVIQRELAALYQAFLTGRPSPLPELPVQYADFAVWQRQWLQGEVLEEQLSYWERQLSGVVTPELPTDRPRPAVQAFRGGRLPLVLSPELSQAFRHLSRQHHAALYMTLLPAFQALLHRWTSQQDVVVGTPIANRNHPRTEALIGFFVNTLAMRGDLGGDPSFLELLEQLRETTLEAYAHQDLPFEKLVDHLQIERDLSRNPIFQVVFALQNAASQTISMTSELEVLALSEEARTTRFDLELHLWEGPQILDGILLFDMDLFDHTTIQRLGRHFQIMLAGIAADPRQRLSRLPLLSAEERSQMLIEWNHEAAEYDTRCCLHELFEASAARTPDAVALASAEGQLSYRELNVRANRLAHRLIELGVGAETLVGICLERSMEMVVGLLGILKAGGAYVPIDPEYPRERIEFILDDVQAPVLLTRSAVAVELNSKAVPLCLDREDFAGWSERNPSPRAGSDVTAYVIFTSGSTGRPKGVVVQHRPVLNLIEWINRTFHVGPEDRVLLVASLWFDLSVYDLFGLLAAGGSIHVASDAEVRDPENLARILDSGTITFWDSAPAALQQLVPFLPAPGRGTASLRLAFLSGDWIPLSLPPALTAAFPHLQVIGLGGATEATVWSNFHAIEEIAPEWVSIPYGRAIQNARYYVLDGRLEPCPMGAPGDLYIGGECLSLGYFNRPRLTAERYVPDPFSDRPGGVLYTTGDRARWRAQGHVEFLGRLDNQVKIRGYRIELGEIEAAVIDRAGIEQCVVLAREDSPGSKRLVAYLAVGSGPAPAAETLRDRLQDKLPAYMIPSAFVALESLPLTPNGKVDRRALPAPEDVLTGPGTYVAPRTPTETRLAEIWCEVLDRDRIGIDDNFFEIGGDSIRSIGVVVQAIEAGMQLTPQDVFEHQTIAELAAMVDAAKLEQPPPPAGGPPEPERPEPFALAGLDPTRVEQMIRDEPRLVDLYPLAPMQGDMLVHSLAFRQSDVNFLQFYWPWQDRRHLVMLRRAWELVFQRHDALRTALRWENLDEPLQALYREVEAPWEEHDCGPVPADERPQRLQGFLQRDRARGFALDEPPLARLSLLSMGDDSGYLVWSAHHVLLDGWSTAIVVNEVFELYQAFCRDQEPTLASPRPYRDYLAWFRRQDLARAEVFWRRSLKGMTAPTPLWIDHLPTPGDRPAQIRRQSLDLSPDRTRALRARVQQRRLTVATVLHGLWALLLSRYGGQEDVTFGATFSGRPAELPGVDSMVGLFINSLPVRIKLSGNPPLLPWLEKLQEQLAELRQYEHTPQSKVREWSELPGGQPLYDSMLVFGNLPAEDWATDPFSAAPQGFQDEWTGQSYYFGARTSSRLTLISYPSLRLPLHLIYDGRFFDPSTVLRMLHHLRTLVAGMVAAEPGRRLADLALLTVPERHQLVTEPDRDGPRRAILKKLLAQRAARLPASEAAKVRKIRLSPRLRIHLLDSRGDLVPLGVPGEVCLGGVRMRRTTLNLLGMSGEEAAAGTPLCKTGALARRLPDGDVEWLGGQRSTRIGGSLVLPEMVEAALARHSALNEAAVLVQEERPGEKRLVAYVAGRPDAELSRAAAQGFLQRSLPWHLVPADFVFLEALPRDARGQVDHQALLELDPSRWTRLEEYGRNVLFQDPFEAQLLQIWEEVFNIRPIAPDDDFFSLGGDSILAVGLVDKIQRRLGRDLPLATFFATSTVRQIAHLLRQQADGLAWSPLVRVKPDGTRPPFFCVHAAGGNVLGFNELVRHLERDQPFYALQSVGLDGLQEPEVRMEAIAARYLDEIGAVQVQGPYHLGGHSFGGYVAYEMACQLERQGEQVGLLALFDVWSPVFRGRPVLGESQLEPEGVLAAVVNRMARLHGRDFSLSPQQIAAAGPSQQIDYALDQIDAAGIDPGVDRERMRRLLKIQLSALEAMRSYVPPSYPGRITVFRALEEDRLLMETNRHPALGDPELHEGWSALTPQPLEIRDVPGNHGTMLREPHVRILARLLTASLDQAQDGS